MSRMNYLKKMRMIIFSIEIILKNKIYIMIIKKTKIENLIMILKTFFL